MTGLGVIDCVVAPHTPQEVAEGQVGVDEHFMDKVRLPDDMRRGIPMEPTWSRWTAPGSSVAADRRAGRRHAHEVLLRHPV